MVAQGPTSRTPSCVSAELDFLGLQQAGPMLAPRGPWEGAVQDPSPHSDDRLCGAEPAAESPKCHSCWYLISTVHVCILLCS